MLTSVSTTNGRNNGIRILSRHHESIHDTVTFGWTVEFEVQEVKSYLTQSVRGKCPVNVYGTGKRSIVWRWIPRVCEVCLVLVWFRVTRSRIWQSNHKLLSGSRLRLKVSAGELSHQTESISWRTFSSDWKYQLENFFIRLKVSVGELSRWHLQTQQTFASPHFPMGTPPTPRHPITVWHVPSIAVVVGFGVPGMSDVTMHGGPDGAVFGNPG